MAGGKWVIIWAVVSLVYTAPLFSETHGVFQGEEGRALRNCHNGRRHPYGRHGNYGLPGGGGYPVNNYGGYGTQFPSYGSYGAQSPGTVNLFPEFNGGLPGSNDISNPNYNRYLTGLYNPYNNPYLGCSSYLPTANYSGYPNYSFGYWSPSNGGYGVNYTQPGLYRSYQYGPYSYGYPSSISNPYGWGVTGYPSYGTGSLFPQPGLGYGYPYTGTGSTCQLLCGMRAGF